MCGVLHVEACSFSNEFAVFWLDGLFLLWYNFLMKAFIKKHRRWLLLLLLIALIFLVFYVFDIFCLFRAVTGIPCPSCGMTRAWFAVARLDFRAAFRYHPLFLLAPVLLLFITDIIKIKSNARKFVLIAIAVLFFAVYAVRMLVLFPHTPPMTVREDALLPRFFAWLHGFF
ncbi:MAG: DUF2752 domain-containing protein [Oscillospiraceae bacterium]|jgi:hypothetical protein|nr:DUF2752 domain-containing protein [Oscillospiraceae bacterium]